MSDIPETAAALINAWLGLDPDQQSIIEMLEEKEHLKGKIASLRNRLKEQE